jgi:transcriptional regulator with PAS, ATPase and Fis domain
MSSLSKGSGFREGQALTADDAAITPDGLSERVVMQRALHVALPHETSSLKQARLTFEREYVAEVLRQNQGNAARSAKLLGISRQMLQQKIKVYGLRAS